MQTYSKYITRQIMAILYKTVMQNGSGDYTDFVSGVADILASGLAATGYYTEYVLSVDNGDYSGYFVAEVPYSGYLRIIGSGTWWTPSQVSEISGYSISSIPNVELEGFCIRATNTTDIFTVYPGSSFTLSNSEILQATNGIINSGELHLDNVSAQGVGQTSGGCFVLDYGRSIISNSRIANFVSGLYTCDSNINNSVFIDNGTHIVGYSGLISISDSLIYNGGSGVVFECTPTGELFITNSTIKVYKPLVLSGVLLQVGESIFYGNSYCIYGSVESGLVENSIMYPSGTTISLTENNVINEDPQFKDTTVGDFRLVFYPITGSPAVEIKDKELFSDDVTLYTEQAQFNIYDNKGISHSYDFLDFIYKQGNTIFISDYMKETKFAEVMTNYSDLSYSVQMNATFEASGVLTKPSINRLYSPFPYDWDYKTFNTTEITDRHRYIIPRAVVDIAQTVSPFIGAWLPSMSFAAITKPMITPYMFGEYRGIAYDAGLSIPGKAVIWTIEGISQMLIKTNAFTGERLAEYPLFVPTLSGSQMIVKPSGVIFVGVDKDQYKFVLESDPSTELLCDNRDGYFKWISTEIDSHLDARGVLAYKDNLYITVTQYYPQSIYDRTTTLVSSGAVGVLVRYDNNNTFEHFIANYTTTTGPSGFILNSGNAYPTDLTVYEDGKLMIADWNNNDLLYKYKLAYDYALVQSSYDTETRIILRETYDSVEL